ncbi:MULTISPECIES: mechanosensitive ion channel family protein [unclassified Streptococcus]|uniref:mechanosensitive ion channel family protein n=1 Tax=unclassified Streptococcus TaxID=2608887 RepID=UPI0014300A77|nr:MULTISPECIES: mechanosensitive ion channel domain-containing protein [unclassified Streptococcus]MBF0787981.1 mechanosensitive ion channel family protein [Streptococcus sp. 19428wC2_LYSM12]MCQ9211955.1 mechanosensitive ion channel family protein [Streptococcus sp. B01]MCQ9213284.1 mechanosensitive ion channel family protein [Streptococcus sp. O1]
MDKWNFLKDGRMIMVAFVLILYAVVRWFTDSWLVKQTNLSVRFIGNLLKSLTLIVGLVLVLSQFAYFGDFIKTLLANSALVVAVLGFALQHVIRNLLAGLLLIQSEAFKIGDRVRLSDKNVTGVIEEMNLHYTVIKLYTNERAIIPNYIMNETVVINNDKKDSTTSYPLSFYIGLDKDLEVAIAIITKKIQENPSVLNKNDTKVTLSEINERYVKLKAFIWTRDIGESFEMVSTIKLEIIKELQQQGLIDIKE